jgi:integrase
MIIPRKNSATKKTWITFYNHEAATILQQYLESRNDTNPKVFPIARTTLKMHWKDTYQRSVIHITPQRLREWFCCELARLGVKDRYVDAFCGRVPRSILARHYTDFSPNRLKEIYDQANLKVLT